MSHIMPALALALPAAACAADDAELRALREEMARIRASFEQRIDMLERKLAQAEAQAGSAGTPDAPPQASTAVPNPSATSNAFNPDVSLILSASYGATRRDPDTYRITGFHLPAANLDEARPARGFSLAESELSFSANVDHLFYGQLNLSIHPDDSVATEEAFVHTSALAHGLTLKAGRYFSGLGYLNEQHAHTWDFADMPLAYQVFLGGQFNNDGLQLRWLAPTETYLELGAELGRGANYPGSGSKGNGAGAGVLYAHLGGDVGMSSSWRAGLSYLSTRPQNRNWGDTDRSSQAVTNRFSGRSRLWIVDAVWKWAPNGNATRTNFKLQGEYLRRTEKGDVSYDVDGASLGPATDLYSALQTGWYLQGVYQFAPYWRLGLRTERLHNGAVDYAANNAALLRPDYSPARNSFMIDYNPSEFSRVRLQLAQDKSRQGLSNNTLILQYQMSLGAHGAHKF
ncbi:MAG: hypothetical protein JNM98_14090 [Rhodocyclaceae bacterium]|nr:hypothetical protein [Rhodocyclaceae bacterium]